MFDYFVSVVILLGVLVAIHEFGHFIIAKACGVRVETFSIGMGKKILKFTRGETEYALSLIPLGGYVKLTGQDPREEVPPELEARSFRGKPLYQRAAVVLAGPLFNAALAVLVFTLLYSVGVPVPASVIGRVLPGSPAQEAGFKAGDHVVEIEDSSGKKHIVQEYSDLEKLVSTRVGERLTFKVERSLESQEETLNIQMTPVLGMDRDSTLGVNKERGILAGVERAAPGPILALRPDSWASQRQIPFGFWVTEVKYSVSGAAKSLKVDSFFDLEKAWTQATTDLNSLNSGEIILVGHRSLPEEGKEPKADEIPEVLTYTLSWVTAREKAPLKLEEAGFYSAENYLIEVKDGTPAAKMGLKKGDRIVSINSEPVLSFQSFRDRVQKLAHAGQPIKFQWTRGKESLSGEISPEKVMTTDPLTEAKKEQFQIGAAFLALSADTPKDILKATSFGNALSLGVVKSYQLTATMVKSFYYLATGEISPKTLGGPILIGKIAGESFRQGWVSFLRTMAFISLNLFILNLFPIPVLDGGHLVLFIVEAIRRKPLSIKIIEAWTTAGFFLLMGLVAVVFFNDLSRLGVFRFFNL